MTRSIVDRLASIESPGALSSLAPDNARDVWLRISELTPDHEYEGGFPGIPVDSESCIASARGEDVYAHPRFDMALTILGDDYLVGGIIPGLGIRGDAHLVPFWTEEDGVFVMVTGFHKGRTKVCWVRMASAETHEDGSDLADVLRALKDSSR